MCYSTRPIKTANVRRQRAGDDATFKLKQDMASPVIYPSRLTAPRFKVFEISFECSLATCPMIISEKSRKLEKNSEMATSTVN